MSRDSFISREVFNIYIENHHLTHEQTMQLMLVNIDKGLKNDGLSRTVKNRLTDAKQFFNTKEYSDFEKWLLTEYIEHNMEVVKEVRQGLLDQIKEITKEERFLSQNNKILSGRALLQDAVEQLKNLF